MRRNSLHVLTDSKIRGQSRPCNAVTQRPSTVLTRLRGSGPDPGTRRHSLSKSPLHCCTLGQKGLGHPKRGSLAPKHNPGHARPSRLWSSVGVILALCTLICSTGVNGAPTNLTKRGPSSNWWFELRDWLDVPNSAGIEDYWVFPDSHISTIKSIDGDWITFWSNCQNWRSRGPEPFLEKQNRVEPNRWFYGGRTRKPGVDNGGRWLMSVHRHPTDGNRRHFVAFTHMEDGYWPYQGAGNPAWGSIGVSHSYDEGLTWEDRGQIITSRAPRPSDNNPQFGGVGNHVAVWDKGQSRWFMIFSERFLGAAVSYDPDGSPGSWQKWSGWRHGFNSAGIGGRFVPLPSLAPVSGSNPSLQWNTVLQRWILMWAGWDLKLWISASTDGLEWDAPRLVTVSVDGTKAWYPTLISWDGNEIGGSETALYYADKFQYPDRRQVIKRKLIISRND